MQYNTDNIKRLTDKHIRRYTEMLEHSKTNPKNYRPYELVALLDIWKSIESKGYVYDKLSTVEQREVVDAVESWE